MFKLLNRIVWILSLTFGFIIAFIFIGIEAYNLNSNEIFFSGIWGVIAGVIIKKVIFSKKFIEERLEFFANSIKNNYIGQTHSSVNTENSELNLSVHPEKENIEEKQKEEILNLSEIKQEEVIKESEINNDFNEIEKEKIIDMQNNENYTQVKSEPNAFDIFLEKTGAYIKDFFSTNLLAKLGSILVFLAVIYFLKGFVGELWEVIGPVGRIIVGIIIGFVTYFIGVKIHTKYENEGLILMGTGILINFAVILSGRYLVGDGGYLAEGTTFIFLILNTIFAVLTSLIYKSKTLLLFSFIFAFLNPFIIGAESNGQPYTLIGYSLIVSLGALYLSIREANLTLLFISFIAGNLLFLVAPFSDSIGWSSKIILTSILSIATIISINKFKSINLNTSKLILNTFIGAYVFIILNLLNSTTTLDGNVINILSDNFGFIIYNLIIFSLFIFSIKILNNSIKKSNNNQFNFLSLILFVPLLILAGILFSGNLIFTPFVLIGTIITYLIGFIFLGNISNIFSYIFFAILAIFIFLFNLEFIVSGHNIQLANTEFIVTIITSLIFLFSAYYYSTKENLSTLFPIGTIGTILILSPIIVNDKFKNLHNYTTGENIITKVDTNLLFNISVLAIIIFAITNWILPFISKNLFKKENLNNLIVGSLAGALFFAFQIYNFGEIHFPGVTEGFVFLALAIIYFLQAYFITAKLGIDNMKSDPELKNIFYSFTGISISLFSVAIAFVFSEHPEIITTTWLFEATILYFFYFKTKNLKIFWAATLLFIIGLTKFGILLDVVEAKEYLFLISFTVILASFILNLFFINKVKENNIHNTHHILHVIGMAIMGGLLLQIIPSTGHGWSMLGISLFTLILGSFYAKFNFKFLKIVFLILITLVSILHILEINSIFWKLGYDKMQYLKFLQYFVSVIIIGNLLIWNKLNTSKSLNKILLIIISIYGFIISNIFVIDIFEKIFGNFTLTIYWGLIASALMFYGIQKDIIKYRTIGLYFLSLTSAKIFLYDVWQIGNTNSRVAVFAILGVIFITISTLYTKRFGDNLLGEFSFDNLKDTNPDSPSIKDKEVKKNTAIKKEKLEKNIEINPKEKKANIEDYTFIINKNIKDIDVGDYKSVKFKINNGKNISIRTINLLKISKLIIDEYDKTNFEAGELSDIFKYIKSNYKTNLSKSNYDKILEIIEQFVENGGEIELIKK